MGLFGGGFGGLRSRSPIRRPRRSSAGPLKAMAGRARFGPLRGDPSKRFGILRVRFGSVRRRSGHCGCPRVRFGSVRRCSGHCRPLRVSSGSFGSFRVRSEVFGSLQTASGLFGSLRRCSGDRRPLGVSSGPFGPVRKRSDYCSLLRVSSVPFGGVRVTADRFGYPRVRFGSVRRRSGSRRPLRVSSGPVRVRSAVFGSLQTASGVLGSDSGPFGSVRRCSSHCRQLRVSSAPFGGVRVTTENFGILRVRFGSFRTHSGPLSRSDSFLPSQRRRSAAPPFPAHGPPEGAERNRGESGGAANPQRRENVEGGGKGGGMVSIWPLGAFRNPSGAREPFGYRLPVPSADFRFTENFGSFRRRSAFQS